MEEAEQKRKAMDNAVHFLYHGIETVNKAACLGVVLGVVWFLQRVANDEKEVKRYPIMQSLLFRVFVVLVGVGFAIDLFSLYRPALSEVIMNLGFLGLVVMVYLDYYGLRVGKRGKKFVNKSE